MSGNVPANESLPPGSHDARIVGSNAWAADGGAPLTFLDKLGQLVDANREYLTQLPGEVRWVLSSRGLFPAAKLPSLGVSRLPETAAVELAVRELERHAEGERELLNHSYRTFHFADLLHRREVQPDPIDREVLAVATLLHDVGMYPKAVAELPGNDFTVRGAMLARRILHQVEWTQYRIDLTAQAITVNANARVGRRWGPEAYFARQAPLVDAMGQCWRINEQDARRVFAEYPAHDVPATLLRCVSEEATRHPGTRFALFEPLFPFLVMNCQCRWHRFLHDDRTTQR